ncbi:replication termination factor 2 [Clupea harengus]|uniref:Replication termination factor 2 n=1 Tax=Clupea harengus TaxID=7950 RepID=A0A6P3VR55_CLUHA|nr:replication termination factor 2 [Clupea harengus]
MGCDGGTIPKRHELVKGPKKVEKVDKNAAIAARWKYCALSQEKLRRPIVSCDLGRFYNKDAVIEYLLDKTAERPNIEVAVHIRGIKDIKELNLTDNPAWAGERSNTKGDQYEDMNCGMFICPVVGVEMNGRHKFCFLQSCGCVFSDRAMKEVKTEICHKCGDTFQEEDIIVLNGTKEEVEKLQERMEEKRAKAKAGKKSKKSKVPETVSKSEDSQAPGPSDPVSSDPVSSSTSSDPSKATKRSSTTTPTTSSTTTTTTTTTIGSKRSIQGMKDKTELYKSLFTSHSSAKRTKDQTSNWVTHTPYHF